MRDVVLVPCYERPEYTRVCLEYLSRARGIENKEVWLCQDDHNAGDEWAIAEAMQPNYEYGLELFPKRFSGTWMGSFDIPNKSYGNSANIIFALRTAYESNAERIFLVEDDIMVSPDIFEWHEAILDDAHPFVSCATSLNKSAHFHINGPDKMDESIKDPNAYVERIGPYSSHAVAFRRFAVGDLLNFFQRDNRPVWTSGFEQDIFTQSYLKMKGHRSAWPYVPRAWNVGLHSYHINTGMKFNGTLEEKCLALRKTIIDPEKLRSMSGGNQTITPVPTEFVERTGPLVRR